MLSRLQKAESLLERTKDNPNLYSLNTKPRVLVSASKMRTKLMKITTICLFLWDKMKDDGSSERTLSCSTCCSQSLQTKHRVQQSPPAAVGRQGRSCPSAALSSPNYCPTEEDVRAIRH